jgi:hypothetical protein
MAARHRMVAEAALRKLVGCRVTLVRPRDVRYGSPHSEPLDLDLEFLECVADLPRRQAEDPGRFGLHPAGALHGINQALAFRDATAPESREAPAFSTGIWENSGSADVEVPELEGSNAASCRNYQ